MGGDDSDDTCGPHEVNIIEMELFPRVHWLSGSSCVPAPADGCFPGQHRRLDADVPSPRSFHFPTRNSEVGIPWYDGLDSSPRRTSASAATEGFLSNGPNSSWWGRCSYHLTLKWLGRQNVSPKFIHDQNCPNSMLYLSNM